MKKILAFILTALYIRGAVAVEKNLLETSDGNVWEVKERLIVGKTYIVLFDDLRDNIVENDEIIRVYDT